MRRVLHWLRTLPLMLCVLQVLPERASAEERVSGRRASIVRRASKAVGLRSVRQVERSLPDDCAGFVRASYASAGLELLPPEARAGENAVTAIHRQARRLGALRKGRPRPGDLVFFRETYDRNRDGRRNDGLTHVGVVERVERNGTVTFVHRGSRGIARARMNVQHPRARKAPNGSIWNDFIRARSKLGRSYLAGELFAGYASAEAFARARSATAKQSSAAKRPQPTRARGMSRNR